MASYENESPRDSDCDRKLGDTFRGREHIDEGVFLARSFGDPIAEATPQIDHFENDHVAQLITDAVFNAEHAGPGIPGHHRDTGDLRSLHAHTDTPPTALPRAGEGA